MQSSEPGPVNVWSHSPSSPVTEASEIVAFWRNKGIKRRKKENTVIGTRKKEEEEVAGGKGQLGRFLH